jgi:hypothetical protein
MIVGNPHAGARFMSALLAVLMALIFLVAVVAYRKTTAPAKVLPLHPSLLLVLPLGDFLTPTKLELFDPAFISPIYNEEIVFTSMQTIIVSSRRFCPTCQGELLIQEGTVTAISDLAAV